MRFRTWPVAALCLAGLLTLIVFSLATAYGRARDTSGELESLNRRHREIFTKLRQVRTDVYMSAIYVRDYLLDNERARDPGYRDELARFRDSSRRATSELAELLPPEFEGEDTTAQLRSSLEIYWTLVEPLFYWTPAEKISRSAAFVRSELLHRREEALALAREIEALNDASYDKQRAEIVRRRTAFQEGLLNLLWQTLVIGLVVSVVAVSRLRLLERRQDEQREFAEAAEQRMRGLSQQIVATQEEERRKLSRELHDHVGQLLTGLRLSLGRIERSGADRGAAVLADARRLTEDLTRLVRDLSLGLRPSMLDDLGLRPALEWLGRDVGRRSDIPVLVEVDPGLAELSDPQRTCIYRVVQEALNNAIKHAAATRVEVRVRQHPHAIVISVADDGRGFSLSDPTMGMGLRGLEERVKELSGSVRVESVAGSGTTIVARLPIHGPAPAAEPVAQPVVHEAGQTARPNEEEEPRARLAG